MLFYIVQFTWGILQNLIGLLLFVLFAARGRYWGRHKYAFVCRAPFNVSLGCFIFVKDCADTPLVSHEYGHTLQSLILGPFYLLFIGLPSVIWAGLFEGLRKRQNISYYFFYTEKWANSLAGIDKENQ